MSALPLRVVIVDDEPLARSRLKSLVGEVERPRCAVVADCASAEELRAVLKHGHADCVLLDIQMPGTSGLELAAQLRAEAASAPAIVFVTAHDQHALQAFELEAVDYLTKPVRRERLQAALERVERQRKTADASPEQAMLLASERGRVARIPVADILYLKAEAKYVNLVTRQRVWVLDDSLTELENRLGDGERFIRIHRNALVAREAITAFEKRASDAANDEPGDVWAVHVAVVDAWLAVSRRQLATVKDALGEGVI